MESLINIFVALTIFKYNFRLLHWKTKGLDFDTKHELVDKYYDQLHIYHDDIAEIILMLNGRLLALNEVMHVGKESDREILLMDGNDYYDNKKIFELINQMFNQLVDLYEDACNDEELTGDIVSKLQEHQYYFRKECRYKGKNRLLI
jgi:DNA-binding ferritin-like protein